MLLQTRDVAIGPDVRTFYERAGRIEAYPDHLGLPVVLGLAFLKEPHACAC